MSPTSELHYRSCNLCEAMCGIEVELQGRSIKSIRGDKNDPFSKGHICPKALALKDLYDDPDRLTRPQKKTPEGWKEISWDEAFDEVARRLKQTQKQHGKDAVGVYLGNPNVHNLGALLFGVQFLRVLRTKNRYSATSVDQLPHMFVASQMFGHQLFMPIPDIDRTRFWVIMGGNPVVSNGSIMSSPDVKRRLKDIQKRGGQVIVIDPRRTQTAALADQHHFITPGTDVFLLLAVLHIIFRDDLVRLGHLQDCLKGLDEVRTLAQAYPPSLASEKTGIKEEDIEQLAHTFAKTESAVWYGRMGVSTQSFGAMCQWLINVINIVTGHFDTPGGLMFTSPAFDLIEAKLAGRGRTGRWTTRKRQLPEFGGELPTSALAEEILTEGEGQIKAMITVAGNPILTTPNGTQLERAFETLDFLVCVDFYLNETTR
ncbi:MAG TPA: dehydrogenase, partial [Myxococcales bacterium]|nr:dehydrogenase [Myxococcales bacterium]